MYCSRCGTRAEDSDVFCMKCGVRIKRPGVEQAAGGADASLPNELEREARRIEKMAGVETAPRSAEEWLKFGMRCFQMRLHDKAIEACLEAVRLKPEFSEAWGFLGNQYSAVGQLDEAVQALSEAVRLNPQDAFAWADLGDVHMRRGDPDRAVRALEEALHLELPRHVPAACRSLWEAAPRDAKRACSGK